MSTEMQLKGHSLERQKKLTKEYADENNLELIESLQDIGLSGHSGANITKGELGRFMQALEDGEIEKDCVLLVESLDRLSRQSPRKAFNNFNTILDSGIEIHTIFDKQIYTSESVDKDPGKLFSSIGVMLRAYSESEDKSIRLKKKWAGKRDNLGAEILTTICPAWLKAREDKSGFDKVAERCETIEKIFDLCIEDGKGTYAIASFLNHEDNREKYPRFTKPKKVNRLSNGEYRTGWQKSYIMKILKNPAVHGEFRPHFFDKDKNRVGADYVIPDYYPEVISKERFALAQARLKDRRVRGGGRKGESFNNIFTKLLKCGNCGASMHYRDKGEPPKGGKYLVCSNKDANYQCQTIAWRYDDFEEDFFAFVSGVRFGDVLRKKGDKSRLSVLMDQKLSTEEQIYNKSKQLDNTIEIMGSISDSAKKKISEKIEKLSLEIDELDDKLSEIHIEISDIESRSVEKNRNEIISAIKEQQEASSDEERVKIRRRINHEIAKVVKTIRVHSNPGIVNPWEVMDRLSPQVVRKLQSKGYNEAQIENLFANDYGRRLFNEYERYFVVKFKNGSSERVHPYLGKAWKKRTNERFLTFIDNIKKRRAEQELKEKRRELAKRSVKIDKGEDGDK